MLSNIPAGAEGTPHEPAASGARPSDHTLKDVQQALKGICSLCTLPRRRLLQPPAKLRCDLPRRRSRHRSRRGEGRSCA